VSQASGANSQPSTCWNVSCNPNGPAAGPSSWLARATSATATISMAVTLARSTTPSQVRWAIASMLERGGSSMAILALSGSANAADAACAGACGPIS
jgi:hypothetical protein